MSTHASTSSSSLAGFGSYSGRLGLTLLLTIAPFGATMTGIVPHELPLPAIVVLCLGLLLVQLVWFLHPGTGNDRRENTAILVCTGLVIAFIVALSL